jgi:hypothetical protein
MDHSSGDEETRERGEKRIGYSRGSTRPLKLVKASSWNQSGMWKPDRVNHTSNYQKNGGALDLITTIIKCIKDSKLKRPLQFTINGGRTAERDKVGQQITASQRPAGDWSRAPGPTSFRAHLVLTVVMPPLTLFHPVMSGPDFTSLAQKGRLLLHVCTIKILNPLIRPFSLA